jgi:hypothetical protein
MIIKDAEHPWNVDKFLQEYKVSHPVDSQYHILQRENMKCQLIILSFDDL